MVRKSEGKEYKSTDNCEVEADFKESLLKHLDDHGVVSMLSGAKFGKYCGCFWEEIQDAISTVGKAAASSASVGDGICESWSPVASAKSPSPDTLLLLPSGISVSGIESWVRKLVGVA